MFPAVKRRLRSMASQINFVFDGQILDENKTLTDVVHRPFSFALNFLVVIHLNLKLNTEAKQCFATHDEEINFRYSICVYNHHFNLLQCVSRGAVVNTYAVKSRGRRFESIRGFGFFLKGAHYEDVYCGKKLN